MKKPSGRGEWMLWATPIVALVPLWLGSFLKAWPLEWRLGYAKEGASRKSCASNLMQLGRAMEQYVQDYDGKFPPASIGGLSTGDAPAFIGPGQASFPHAPVGWTGALLRYTRDQSLQFCPAQVSGRSQRSTPSEGRSPTSPGFTDYWLNARLAGHGRATLSQPGVVFLLGEGNDGSDASNATYSKDSLPSAWASDTQSPLYRHLSGSNYLFADGRVMWLTPRQAFSIGRVRNKFVP